MRIKQFAPEEHFEENPFTKKRIRINEENDIDEMTAEEEILEEMQPWEHAFERGCQMANEEFD
ncbi:hypothetical protein KY338_06465 [Candidatus Woesearchaeota archaeon]|nr:hypothetical protein [Candidatus Woesearchaeota archaeon]MBW3006466.1 hypothetical protein [Candidatus Woesearchaeota archaeon]